MRAQLLPLDGSPPVDVLKDMTLVGRKEECDLRLDHKSISKMHCVIVKTDGLLLLRDLGSTNGTRVNGQRVRRAALLPNDQIAFASFKYRVAFGPDEKLAVPSAEHTQHLDAKEVAAGCFAPGTWWLPSRGVVKTRFAFFPCERPQPRNASAMSKPSGTDWDRVDALTDEQIDTSDVPELPDSFFDKATLRVPRKP